jgi:hypothetical protein
MPSAVRSPAHTHSTTIDRRRKDHNDNDYPLDLYLTVLRDPLPPPHNISVPSPRKRRSRASRVAPGDATVIPFARPHSTR